MKLLLSLFLYSNLLFGQVWMQLPDFPAVKRDDGVAVVVNGKAYIGTGLQEWSATIDFYALDLATLTWSVIPTMPHTTERQYACAFPGINCFYVFGGEGGVGPLNNMYKYDIATSSWMSVSPKPGNGLVGAMCMSFGDKVIISGGQYSSGFVSNEVWEYTISSNSWTQKNNYPFAGRWRSGATVLNGKGYLCFGRDTSGAFRKELYSYDPLNDSWTKISDFPSSYGRAYAALNHTNTKLCVFGGQDTLNIYHKDLWYFDPTNNLWMQGPDLPSIGRRGGMSCNYEDLLIYTCGLGEGNQRLTETWMTHIPVGIEEKPNDAFFSLYPNPAGETIRIGLNNLYVINTALKIQVTDVLGNEICTFMDQPINGTYNVSALSKGVYLIKIFSGVELKAVKKLIKD